jgi:hypothetical protein
MVCQVEVCDCSLSNRSGEMSLVRPRPERPEFPAEVEKQTRFFERGHIRSKSQQDQRDLFHRQIARFPNHGV